MTGRSFESYAERAKKGQWRLADLPWDEPIRFCGASKREQMLCKLDTVDLTNVMYHLQLGARMRLGDHLVRAWSQDASLLACMEWHDADEARHVRALRKLLSTLHATGESLERNDRPPSPQPVWDVVYSSRERLSSDRLLLHLVIDEAVSRALFGHIASQSRIPLVRATFEACAQDDLRHAEYLSLLAVHRFKQLGAYAVGMLRAAAVLHVARLQSALRPYINSFAGCGRGGPEKVVGSIFGAASLALSELGADWQRSPLVHLVQSGDRSPWMLWLLR